MNDEAPSSQTMKISDVRGQLNTLVNQVYRHETRVVVEKSGIPVAALVSTEDLELLGRFDREREERRSLLAEFRAPFRDVPDAELEREIERALAEVREENRVDRAQSLSNQ